jgi:hypothetical protein
MAEFMERVRQVSARSSSPDGQIVAMIDPSRRLGLEFTDGAFERYREAMLERQLGALAGRLWIEYQRAYVEVLTDVTGVRPTRSSAAGSDLDPQQRRYREACAAIHCACEVHGGRIRVVTDGLTRWSFSITPGTLAQLSRTEFCRLTQAAAQAAMDGQFDRAREIRDDIYGDPRERTMRDPWRW